MICHDPETFGDHRHGDNGEKFLICHVTTCLKGCVNLWVEAPHGMSPLSHVWWPLVKCKCKYTIFNFSSDL